MTEDERDYLAVVMPSPLDARVWCVVIPDVDQHTGTLHASTSVRRCKEWAEDKVRESWAYELAILEWVREEDSWTLYEKEDDA